MERNDQLKNFKKNVLDTVSPTVCSAKWLEATMWLYDGVTASCHHNPTHKIQLDPNHMEREDIEEAILKHTGKVISLEPGTFETQELESISGFDQAVAKACQEKGFSSEMIQRCQSPVL